MLLIPDPCLLTLVSHSRRYHVRGIEGVTGCHGMDGLAMGTLEFKRLHFKFDLTVFACHLQGCGHELFRKSHGADLVHDLGTVIKAS